MQKFIADVKAKQEKVDPIEALELNDEIAFWEGVKAILAERNGVTAENTPVAENEMQPVEGVNTSIAEATADAQAFMAAAQADTVDAYQGYLDNYPDGAYRNGARAGIWKIEGIEPDSYGEVENARSAAAKVLQDNIAQPVNGDVVAPVADEDVNAVGNADTTVDNQGNPIDANGKLIVDGVTSIDEITDEDFENPTRNVQLPALPENVANAIGTEGRPVVIKKNVFEKNNKTHVELEPENSRDILRSALYNPDIVGSTQPIKRPDYKVAIRTGEKNAIVVLDVYRGKDYVEIVGWRMINEKGLAKMQRQAEREGGQFLILSPKEGSAAALSALPLGQSSASEDTTPTADVQEISQESGEITENGGEKDVIEEMREQERIAKEREERAGVPPRPSDYSDAISRGNAEAMKAWEEKFNEYAQKLNSDDLTAIEVAIRDMQGLKETIKAGNPKGYKENTNYKAFDYIEKALKKRKKEIEQSSTNVEKQKVVEDSSTEQVTGKLPASEQTENAAPKKKKRKSPTTPQELAQAVAAQAEENRRQPLRERAQEWQEKLGVQVNVIESVDEVKNSAALRAINEGERVAGWFSGGKVYVYMPGIEDMADLDKTVVHEVVAHKGLQSLMGDKFDALCDKVWESMDKEAREKYLGYVGARDINAPSVAEMRAAADEYMAFLAEGVDLTDADRTVWQKIVEFFREFVEKLGVKMSDKDIELLIKASYANLRNKAAANNAQTEGETIFRLASSNASAVKYDKANGTNVREFFDFLRGGKVFEKGKPNVFHIANAGSLLEQYGIKGKFMVGQFTFSRTHTQNEDHNLGIKEWVDVINNLNNPLAITSYKGLPNEYRIYTYATVNGKNICVGVNVSLKNGEIELSRIISAYGRDINNLLGKEGVNLLYPDMNELKRRISQGSTAHNSLLNATSTASADKDNASSVDLQEENGNSADTRFRIANRSQEVFVSNARKAVEEIKQEKATPQQWLAMLKKNGGLKAGEDAWMGLSEWLENSESKSLTKQELLDFINENAIKIEEVEYRDDASDNYAGTTGFLRAVEEQLEEDARYHAESEVYPDEFDNEEDYLYAIRSAIREYKEDPTGVHYDIAAEKVVRRGDGPNFINSTRLDYTTDGLDNKREIALVVPTIEPYNESDEVHFGNAGGGRAVAWVRFGETTDSEGKRVLVIDEIQSKRHQDGREKGYKSITKKEYDATVDAIEKAQKTFDSYNEEMAAKYGTTIEDWPAVATDEEIDTYQKLYDNVIKASNVFEDASANYYGGVPSAPFEKNWHELAMKRMLRLAAEEGFDKVAWTTGEQQAQRYDMSRQVESIDVEENIVEEFSDGTPVAKNITISTANGMDIRIDTDADGVIHGGEYGGRNIADVVGKELAVKIMQPGNFKLEGEGLRIGGEGMKGFYDRMLPSFVSKYTKKWGAKVGSVEMPSLEQNNVMHSVDITPAMSESVMEGQTMFRFIGERGAANLDRAEEATTRLDNLAVAREMEAAGKEAKAIKLATGWERGADGKWRYETEDIVINKNAVFHDVVTGKELAFDEKGYMQKDGVVKLGDFVEDKELFEAYPELRDYTVSFQIMPVRIGAAFEPYKKNIILNRKPPYRCYEMRSKIAHEIQHTIQHIEGFAMGGNKNMDNPKMVAQKEETVKILQNRLGERYDKRDELLRQREELWEKISEWNKRHPDGVRDEEIDSYIRECDILDEIIDAIDENIRLNEKALDVANEADTSLGMEGYKRLAGEVESRNVQKRMDYTEEQRRNELATETEDVRREDQIFIYDALVSALMGSRVDARMAEVAAHFEGKQLTAEQQAVADVFGGKADNLTISVKTQDGNERKIVMRQGNETGAGAKHSLYRHYGTGVGVIASDDIISIPDVVANGVRTEKQRGKTRLAEYKLTDANGNEFTVLTEIKKGKEIFNDFYSNKKAPLSGTFNTQSAHTANNNALSADKGSENISNSQEDSATRLRYEPSKHDLEVAGRLIEARDRIKAITGAKGYGSNSAYIEGETEDGEKWVIRVADHPANMSNFEDKNEDAEYILSIVIDEEFDEKNAAKHHEKITNDENVWQVVVNPLDIDYDALTRGVERFKRTGEGQYVYGNVNDVMFRIGGSEHSIKKSELRREVQRVDADITSAVNDTAAELNTEVQIVSDIADVPDARTIWKYREEPTRCGAYDELFKQFYAHLQSLGLIVNEGKIIDASFVVSPRQRNTREENRAIKKGEGGSLWNDNPHKKCHKDIDARWTKKGGETFYGYKNHAKVCSKTKLITGYDTTSASIYTIYYRVVTLTEKTEIYTKIRKSFANFVETKSQ